jgi:hypothetical protein
MTDYNNKKDTQDYKNKEHDENREIKVDREGILRLGKILQELEYQNEVKDYSSNTHLTKGTT